MDCFRELDRYQKALLILLALMAVVFLAIYGQVSGREGYRYNDRIFVPETQEDVTVYTGKLDGQEAAFTVTGNKGEAFVTVSDLEGTIVAGDGFILDGCFYRFTEGGEGKLAIDQKLMADCDGAAATAVNAPNSVAFHRNAIALVSRNLALPMGASNAAYASAGGLGVRVVYDYDSATKTDKISFDVIYGVKDLDDNLICRLTG